MLELELEREHQVRDERKEEQSYEEEVSENAVINKEYSIFEKASDEVTDDCNEEEEEIFAHRAKLTPLNG